MPAPAPARPPARPYLPEPDLAAELARSRAAGGPTPELWAMLAALAGGVWDRYRPPCPRDEFVADAALHLAAGPVGTCDPARRPFGYLTTACLWHARRVARQARRRTLADAAAEAAKGPPPAAGPGRPERTLDTLGPVLADFPRRAIGTPDEYEAAAELLDALLARRDRTPRESDFADALYRLVSDYKKGLTCETNCWAG